jgi:hypothetical protein
MPLYDDPPLHDFPDRAIRRLMEDPANLRDLVAAVLPGLVDRLDFSRVELLPREFLLEDWRKRENDLLFRLPFLAEPDAWALLCLLVEHQSDPDPVMPLRLLLYAVLFWESEWRAWEAGHPEGAPLRLTPVIPIVFHTGTRAWRTHRELVDLMAGPEEMRAFAPRWPALFWELGEHTPEELLAAAGEWLTALAVVRSERVETATFLETFQRVLEKLAPLGEEERVRWHDLLWFILSWALRRGPGVEGAALIEAVRRSQMDVRRREEATTMSETVMNEWERRAEARGRAQVEAQVAVQRQEWEQEAATRAEARMLLETRREDLRLLLEEKFGALPTEVAERIAAIDDPERLREAIRQVVHLQQLDDLVL